MRKTIPCTIILNPGSDIERGMEAKINVVTYGPRGHQYSITINGCSAETELDSDHLEIRIPKDVLREAIKEDLDLNFERGVEHGIV